MIAKRKIILAAREAFSRFASFLLQHQYVSLLSGAFQYAHKKKYFQEEMAVGF
jgi:hypothetical protein